MTAATDITAIGVWLKSQERKVPNLGIRDESQTGTYASLVHAALTAVPDYQWPGADLSLAERTQRRGNLFLFTPTSGGIPPDPQGITPPSGAIPSTVAAYPWPHLEKRWINSGVAMRARYIINEVKAGKLPNVVIVALPTASTTISAALAAAGISNPGTARGLIAIPTHAMEPTDAAAIEALLPVS